jgi:tRNA threonylcarbamoyladenosine biosynthesis protein TsaE
VIKTFITHSEDETAAIGRDLASRLASGSVILLIGDLGAGKTAFVRGLADGLGCDPTDVSSPTFTLIQEYRGGRLPLTHADLYRLTDPREIDDLGLEEIGSEGVLTIEWADKLRAVPPGAVRIDFEHVGDNERRLTIDVTPTDSFGPSS